MHKRPRRTLKDAQWHWSSRNYKLKPQCNTTTRTDGYSKKKNLTTLNIRGTWSNLTSCMLLSYNYFGKGSEHFLWNQTCPYPMTQQFYSEVHRQEQWKHFHTDLRRSVHSSFNCQTGTFTHGMRLSNRKKQNLIHNNVDESLKHNAEHIKAHRRVYCVVTLIWGETNLSIVGKKWGYNLPLMLWRKRDGNKELSVMTGMFCILIRICRNVSVKNHWTVHVR
jgi:hypothetical protein